MKILSRLFAECAIQIRGGSARCVKGKMMSRITREISYLASEFNMEQGEIWISQTGKVSFSCDIPKDIHQRIRNIIASQ